MAEDIPKPKGEPKEDLASPSGGNRKGEEVTKNLNLYGMVFETGYTIAIPLVLFAWGGRYLDKSLDTSPWLLLTGIVASIFVSSFFIYRKLSTILR